MNLTSISPIKFDNLQTLILKNTGLNATDVLNSNYKTLTRLYCVFPQEANVELSLFTLDYLLKNCKGIDDSGLNIDIPNLQGYITITYPSNISTSKLNQVKANFAEKLPYLNATYKSVPNYFTYNSGSNRLAGTLYYKVYEKNDDIFYCYKGLNLKIKVGDDKKIVKYYKEYLKLVEKIGNRNVARYINAYEYVTPESKRDTFEYILGYIRNWKKCYY